MRNCAWGPLPEVEVLLKFFRHNHNTPGAFKTKSHYLYVIFQSKRNVCFRRKVEFQKVKKRKGKSSIIVS